MLKPLLISASFLSLSIGIARAEDKDLQAALKGLDTAIKRIEALETKVSKMSSLEEENKKLKEQLNQTAKKSESISSKSLVAITPSQPVTKTTIPNSKIITATEVAVSEIRNNWSGIYAGINGGYGLNDVNEYVNGLGVGPSYIGTGSIYANQPIVSTAMLSRYYGGPLVGGQFGYNYEFNNKIVAGAEADLDWADVNNNFISPTNSRYFVSQGGYTSTSSTNSRAGLDWLGTAKVRLGYSLGNFLPYLTGGFAYGQLSSNTLGSSLIQYPYSGGPVTGSNSSVSASSVNTGWVLGAGSEYLVADKWSIRGEYLYTQLSGLASQLIANSYLSQNFNANTNYTGSGSVFGNSSMGVFGIHQARVGLNYHTGWLGGANSVAAKY